MIATTQGKNTFTEIKCNSILPLEDIKKVITCKNCHIDVKDVYVKFLFHCHIDTGNESREIFTNQSSLMWAIFESFLADINSILLTQNSSLIETPCTMADGSSTNRFEKFRSFVADEIISVLIGYFGHNLFNHIPNPQVANNSFFYLFIYLVVWEFSFRMVK